MFTNGHGRPAWEDSPRPESVTPQMLSKLKERKHERSWWLRQQALMDKASPLRKSEPPSTMTVHRSAEALSASPSTVAVVDLQKIALFAQDHPVRKLADEEDDVESTGRPQRVRKPSADIRRIIDQGDTLPRGVQAPTGYNTRSKASTKPTETTKTSSKPNSKPKTTTTGKSAVAHGNV